MLKAIAPQYIKEAQRIRSMYIALNDTFDRQLDGLAKYKDDIAGIEQILESLQSEDLTDHARMQGLTSTMVDLQKAADRMAATSKPHQEDMEQLQKEAKILHGVLQERYPEMSDQELAYALEIGYSN